jgi:hypothetical protein
MLSLVILSLYGILILLYVVTCFFIAYHLVNFSLDSAMKIITLVVFIVLSAGLLAYNVLIFFSIDWNFLISTLMS